MAYNIDESINVQGSPEIGVWHEPEFKKYQVFSNNGDVGIGSNVVNNNKINTF